MPTYRVKCQRCDREFTAYRGPRQPAPKFCSEACYHAGPRVTRGRVRVKQPAKGRRQVSVKVDGEIVHLLRARWVWNQHNPRDPVGSDEHIHHIDGDPLNDDPANLQKVTVEEHEELHRTFKRPNSAELSRRMLAYHKANPGKQRKGQPRTCPVCGSTFYRPPSAKAVTCSYACMGELQSRTGSSRGERNGNSKLTDLERAEIRTRCAKGEQKTALAREFGVSRDQIARVVRAAT